MEIAGGVVGAALAFLGVILAYIWKANGQHMRLLQEGLIRLQEGQERLMEGQKEITRGIGEVAKMVQETLREVQARG
jgi:hypothetical protein